MAEQDSVDVWGELPKVTFETVQAKPAGVEAERLTVPVSPLRAVTVIVEVAVAPARALTLVGLAVMVKSVTISATVEEWVFDPLLPVTVTV